MAAYSVPLVSWTTEGIAEIQRDPGPLADLITVRLPPGFPLARLRINTGSE